MKDESEIRLAMLISGGGSTMEYIAKSALSGDLRGKVKPVVVISSREDAGGIVKAKNLRVPVEVVPRNKFPKGPGGREAFGRELLNKLRRYSPHVVTQNGWIPLTPDGVIFAYEGNIFNQHPVPLDPDNLGEDGKPLHFGGRGMHGLAAHAAVLKFQELAHRNFPTEATIHRVTTEVDQGAVLYRETVPVMDYDSPESLQARVLPHEHSGHIVFLNQLYTGNIVDLHRESPLILPGEEGSLHQAIIYGRERYPNG